MSDLRKNKLNINLLANLVWNVVVLRIHWLGILIKEKL